MDQRGRFEVSVTGLLLLGVAALVTTGLVFLLGVYVGKGIAEKRYLGRQEVVRVPVKPDSEAGKAKETFWDRLGEQEEGGTGSKKAQAKPSPTPEPAIRIGAPKSPSEERREPTPEATPEPEPTPEPTPERVRENGVEKEPTKAPVPAPVTSGDWFQVQVTALADRQAAFNLVRKLRREGHDARVVEGDVDGRELYRVRVGRYSSRDAADRAAANLQEEGYPEAYPVTE